MKVSYPLFFLLVGVFFFIGCTEDEGDLCEDCENAISNMHAQLTDAQCNPDSLPSESQLIHDGCGSSLARYAIGFMAHNCMHEPDRNPPVCSEKSGARDLNDEEINHVEFELKLVSTDPFNDEMSILIEPTFGEESQGQTRVLGEGESANLFFDNVADGEQYRISVFDVGTGSLYKTKDQRTFFYRPGEWDEIREVRIYFNPDLDEYDFEFEHW